MRATGIEKTFGTIALIQVIFVIAMAVGWVMNVVKLVKCDFEPSYKAEVIRLVGLIPPVGMVVGWMNFEDGATEETT